MSSDDFEPAKIKFDPEALKKASYDEIVESMVQNDDATRARQMGGFLFNKLSLDIEDRSVAKQSSDDAIYAMHKTKVLLEKETKNYVLAVDKHNHKDRRKALAEMKSMLAPFFTEHLKVEPPKKKSWLSFLKL